MLRKVKVFATASTSEYGEYKHCLGVQKKISDAVRESNLLKDIRELKKRYPKKDCFFKPFRPKWSDKFGSKRVWLSEAWDFFLSNENLVQKKYHSDQDLDFSRGVPVDFTF